MLAPASPCLACGAPTRLRHRARTDVRPPSPDDLRCTSDDLATYHDIWACDVCGLAYQAVPDRKADLLAGYEDVADPKYLEEEDRRREAFRDLLDRLERRRAPGRVLEIGAFAGLFCDEASKRGWDAVGVEPSRWAAAHARDALGVRIVEGTIADAPHGPYDVVCTWDVLEHVPDPLDLLRRAGDLLTPSGVIGLSTVNIAGRSSRLLRGRWPWLMRMHLWYFTPRSLTLLLQKAGFTDVELEAQPKRFRLGYVLERSERYAGVVARAARKVARRTGLTERVVTVELGDLLLAFARKT